MSPQHSNEPIPAKDDPNRAAAAEVESLILDLLTEINAGTFSPSSKSWPSVARTFTIRGTSPSISSKTDTMLYVQDRHRQFPSYHVEVTSTKVDVNLKLSVATVWVNLKASGLPEGLTKDVVSVFDLRRSGEGMWLAVGVTNMLGPGVEGE